MYTNCSRQPVSASMVPSLVCRLFGGAFRAACSGSYPRGRRKISRVLGLYSSAMTASGPWVRCLLLVLCLFITCGSPFFAQAEERQPASPADCPLMDPRCLLNYTIEAPDYFYRRRHETPAHIMAARRLQQEEEQGPSQQGGSDSSDNTQEVLSESQIFEFVVRRLQGIGGFFGSQRQPTYTSGTTQAGGRRRQQQPPPLSLELTDPLESGGGRAGRPLLESNGLVCEDDERVEDFGVKCRLIARSLGGRLGCEKRLIDISPDGRLPANIPAFSRVADACPMTCGLCEECAPGCALWFLGNTLCDAVCNNAACQFDGGDCWSADCVVGPWAEWSDCSVTCGGPGAQRRTREVKSRAKQGGSPCPKLEVRDQQIAINSRRSPSLEYRRTWVLYRGAGRQEGQGRDLKGQVVVAFQDVSPPGGLTDLHPMPSCGPFSVCNFVVVVDFSEAVDAFCFVLCLWSLKKRSSQMTI